MPTIEDVAKLAGVSIATVSRVINGSGYVSEKTRYKVWKAIEELGYKPEISAKLLIPYTAMNLPLTVWVLQSFFRELPKEVEESAFIDGASKLRTLWSIVLPMSAPGLVATGLLTFIAAWNEFLFALTFMQKPSLYTVPVAVALFKGASQYEIPWGQLMAAAVIVTLPLVILVLVFQNRIIAGLSAGAVKG